MEYNCISHRGLVRTHNEDSAFGLTQEFYGPEKLSCGLFIVCDGVGGEACGEMASRLAVKVTKQKVMESLFFLDTDYQKIDFERILLSSIQESNKAVIEKMKESPKHEGMATTIAAVLIVNNKAYIGQVGDSRTYIFGPEGITFCSKDHSLVQEEVDKGILTKEQARVSPQKNIITRALGVDPNVEIDMYTRPLYAESTVLVCSDGLWDELSDAEIEEIVLKYSYTKKICDTLLKAANERGGHDNISIIVIRNVELPSREQLKKDRTIFAEHHVKENQEMTRRANP